MNPYWSSIVQTLSPYVPGEQPKVPNLIKLNTNESPYGPSPRVLEAIHREAGEALRLYPDPDASKLKAAIARENGIKSSQVFIGNGSDEVLAHVFLGLLKHDRALLAPDITYSFYPVYAGLYGIDYRTLPVDDKLQIQIDAYLSERPGAIILANPNAPTGQNLPLSAIEELVKTHQDIPVVVDEAYVDFGAQSAVTLIDKYPNLLIVQTVSKSRSLAGLRVGFAMGNAELIDALERIKNCFNSYPLDRLAIAGAVAAFEDKEYFDKCRQLVMASRERLTGMLTELGFEVLPSCANFVFARHPQVDAVKIASSLREQAVLVRHFKLPRIEQYLRITIGTDEQCDTLVHAMRKALS